MMEGKGMLASFLFSSFSVSSWAGRIARRNKKQTVKWFIFFFFSLTYQNRDTWPTFRIPDFFGQRCMLRYDPRVLCNVLPNAGSTRKCAGWIV